MEPIKEVILERTYDASPEEVWRAWTTPALLKQWWGPNNVNIPECEVDLRIGGRFYIVMEAGEGMGQYKGTLWPMEAEFTVIDPKVKLVYKAQAWTEGEKDESTIDQATEIDFIEDGGKTKLKIKAAIYKTGPGIAAEMAVQGMQYGFAEQLEKLSKFLAAKK